MTGLLGVGGIYAVESRGVEEWWLGEDQMGGGTLQFRLNLTPILQRALMEAVWHLS